MAKQARELTPTVTAGSKYVRISAYKVRAVADLIKGKHVDEARRILAFTPKAASHEISKVLESAIANAEHNFQIPQDELLVKVASADEGVTIKRFRARAQGRGYRIRKRTCHINLTLERTPLDDLEGPVRTRRPQKATTPKPAEEPIEEAKPKRTRKKARPAEGTPSASNLAGQAAQVPGDESPVPPAGNDDPISRTGREGGSVSAERAPSAPPAPSSKSQTETNPTTEEPEANKDEAAGGSAAPLQADSGSSTRPDQPDEAAGTARLEAGSGDADPDPATSAESGKDKEGEV